MITIYKIRCAYFKEIEGMNAPCSSEKCIYGDYQICGEGIKGCQVNGHVNPSEIPKSIRDKLTPDDLKARVQLSISNSSNTS